ncbi:hypothetical protein KOR42_32400 [Thalassoglobus neptunius]|uniref:Uncharacterized protein n=1 Tax=Thalassoglobus neptunius TaxID=1938619 RepID=A0A5C5WMV9_9PLAN|nr:hypothetical protein KOR42_32400 [Thalassoglobus neptunius]
MRPNHSAQVQATHFTEIGIKYKQARCDLLNRFPGGAPVGTDDDLATRLSKRDFDQSGHVRLLVAGNNKTGNRILPSFRVERDLVLKMSATRRAFWKTTQSGCVGITSLSASARKSSPPEASSGKECRFHCRSGSP